MDQIQENSKQLIVVLTMHRSGSSAITRGLQACGVSLGDTLHTPQPDNEKGFFEDTGIHQFNENLLAICGQSWYSLEPIGKDHLTLLRDRGYIEQAVNLLQSKLVGNELFGFKDPRTAKLLPFWLQVFTAGKFNVRYVFAVRNPLSIAESLAQRNHFSPEWSYLLWVNHILMPFSYINMQEVLMIDYDCLMRNPNRELKRMASWLGIQIDPEEEKEYCDLFIENRLRHSQLRWPERKALRDLFIENRLRHSQHDLKEVNLHHDIPVLAKEIYAFIVEIISGQPVFTDIKASGQFKKWINELERIRVLLQLLDKQNKTISSQNAELVEVQERLSNRDAELKALRNSISWRITKPLRYISAFFKRRLMCNKNLKEWKVRRIAFDDTTNRYYNYKEKNIPQTTVKLICHYLPQFHPFEENNKWWGHGFTEWTNVTKAVKKFNQHHQPRKPTHMGYYDLRTIETFREQVALAKNYGIYGFSYYFYWFNGKVLMEKPLKNMLNDPSIDMPFCLNWANENWTRRWDGADHDILIAQKHSLEDSIDFIKYVADYFKDKRYIKIDNKPVLMVYRCNIIPCIQEITAIWRQKAIELGYNGLYLIAVKSFGIKDVEKYGFDAASDFPPHTIHPKNKTEIAENLAKEFSGYIYDYQDAVREAITEPEPLEKTFPCVMLSWDNTARKDNNAHIFTNFELLKYKQWLSYSCNRVLHDNRIEENERFVFINAWNEWAEGTYLEPDEQFGYGYLDTTASVIENYPNEQKNFLKFSSSHKRNDNALIIHLHYKEPWEEILIKIQGLRNSYDIYVSCTSIAVLNFVKETCPFADTMIVDNRGRDILPFLSTFNHIKDFGYNLICKVHGKKSVYRNDGDKLRNDLLVNLLDCETQILNIFDQNVGAGIVMSDSSVLRHDKNNMFANRHGVALVEKITSVNFEPFVFPAGSMFWFRPKALNQILKINQNYFDIEQGYSDGTFPHAIERFFAIFAKYNGFQVFDQRGTRYD